MEHQILYAARYRRAFTLVELLITLAVLTILLAAALPGIGSLAGNGYLTTAGNDILAYLQLARSEAVKRGLPVVLCPSDDGRSCADTIEWQRGFIIFVDRDRDRQSGPDDPLLSYHKFNDARLIIKTTVGRKNLRYQPSGMSPGSTATITLCPRQQGIEPRSVILSNSGRSRLSRSRPDGSPLRCDL